MLPRRSRVGPAFFMYARAESMEIGSGDPQAVNGHEQELDHAVGVRAHCRYDWSATDQRFPKYLRQRVIVLSP
jgi:hypothetical protein